MGNRSGYDEQRSHRVKARLGGGILTIDSHQLAVLLDKGILAEHPDRPQASRERMRPGHYEPKRYDSDDSFRSTHNNKRKSNRHETKPGNYPSSGKYRKGRGGGSRQQDHGVSFEEARGSRHHEEVRRRRGGSRSDALDSLDDGDDYWYSDDDSLDDASDSSDDDYGYVSYYYERLDHGFDRSDPLRPWPARHPSYRPLDDDEFISYRIADKILKDGSLSRHARYHEPGPRYPQPNTDYGTFSDEDRYTRRSRFAQHGLGNRDEDDYVPRRQIKGSDRHHRLLEPPSGKGGRRGLH